ncbi:MAG TPA: hypothetical protein VMP01_14335 [Pirellulaceae bacterium]|nr:hypothetical protein [Pirellulaceae bacterium]
MEPEFVEKHFIPLALDTYFRGNSQEVEFCQKVGAGGNHVVVVTAGGEVVMKKDLRLRQRELSSALEVYRRLPKEERTPPLPDPALAKAPQRPVPEPPESGLIVRGYCTYMRPDVRAGKDGQLVRSREYYYKENPDRWAAETQSDLLWLTEAEWKSLIPADPRPGAKVEASAAIQKRFYGTLGIDYMEGSVNSLPVRESTLTLSVEKADDRQLLLRVEGHAQLGKPLTGDSRDQPETRGCELKLVGEISYDREQQRIDRFDLAGVGRAWGNKMNYVGREVRLENHPWHYGIACELVTTDTPADLIPPYNLLHYNSTPPYFAKE